MDNQNQNNNNNTAAAPTTTAPNENLEPNNISMDISNISSINPNSTISVVPPQLQPQFVPMQSAQGQTIYVQQPQPVYMYPNVQYQNGQIPPPPSYQQSISIDQQTMPIDEKGGNNLNSQPQKPQQVVLMVAPNQIPRHSTKMLCPHCNKTVNTKISYEDNALVWGLCIVLFIFTFLCCIPFCIDDLKDVVHYCPICRREIARRERVD